MSVSVTVAGVSYTIPSVGDVSWGPQVTAWIQAISASTLQVSGGSFVLTSDLNFGTSFGLLSKYFTSVTANPASAGVVRLANLDFIKWRNAANNADVGLQLDASNIFQFGGAVNSSGNVTGANLSGTNSGDITLGAFGSSPSATGASLSVQALSLQPADGTHPGSVSTTTQTFGGAKTFSTSVISPILQSSTANAAASGAVRLANADAIAFRNSGNSADLSLLPHADGILQYNSIDLVNLSASQTLTNKTLTAPVIATISNSGTITIPTGTDQLVARGTTDTLTSKTIDAGSNTITNLTNTNLSGSAAISNANLAAMAANKVKANVTGGSATPTDVALVSAATASAAMIRDANANIQANNFIENYTTTATATATTTLTAGSSYTQRFTGTNTQTCKLPDCTTLVLGFQFYIINRSTGAVAVQDSSAGAIQSLATNTSCLVTCTNIGSAAGAWDVQYVANTALINPMTTGGDIIYGGSSGTPTRLANGSAMQVLTSAGTTSAPTWNYPIGSVTSQSTTYAILTTDGLIICSGASFTLTLPTAVGISGKQYTIKHTGTSLSQVYTLATTSAQTIGGIASGSYALYTNQESLTLVSDGANWQILSNFNHTPWVSAGASVITATSAYVFTCTAANATIGATYTNSGFTYTVSATIAGGTTLNCAGTGTPAASGTLTKATGTGDATITYSSKTITGVPIKGTIGTDLIRWRRIGDSAEIAFEYSQTGAGTAGTGDYLIAMPTNLSIDTTKLTAMMAVIGTATNGLMTSCRGAAVGSISASTSSTGGVLPYNGTYFRIYLLSNASQGVWNPGFPGSGLNSTIVAMNALFNVPITGWQP